MWVSMLEKAWAKLKGSYLNTAGGYLVNTIRTLTGVPVFKHTAQNQTEANQLWQKLKQAD